MSEEAVVMLTDPIIEPVIEPAIVPQARLLPRVDIWLRWGGDKYWGTVISLSRPRFTAFTQARIKLNAKVVVRFHFQTADKREVTEELEAKVMWQSGDSSAFEFDPPLPVGSPDLKKAPRLEDYLADKEARR